MKIRAFVAVRDPVVRRTLANALKKDRDIVLVPLPEEADVVVDEARSGPVPDSTSGLRMATGSLLGGS